MKTVRVLCVSDLHQSRWLYQQLGNMIILLKPDVVCVVGDWLTQERDLFPDDHTFSVAACAMFMSQVKQPLVFVAGEHEQKNMLEFEEVMKSEGKDFNLLSMSAAKFDRLTIVGFPPAGYGIDHFSWLQKMYLLHGKDMGVLWLAHEPPVKELAGNRINKALASAIRHFKPSIVVSGHNHTLPIRTGIHRANYYGTCCLNAGQYVWPEPGILRCLLIEMDFLFERRRPHAYRVALFD